MMRLSICSCPKDSWCHLLIFRSQRAFLLFKTIRSNRMIGGGVKIPNLIVFTRQIWNLGKWGLSNYIQLQFVSTRSKSPQRFHFIKLSIHLIKKALRGCIKSPIYQSHEQWSRKSYSFFHLLWINSRIFLFVSAKSNNNNPYWMHCPEIGIKMLHQMMFDFDKQPFSN